jgi:hypothetical protein
MSSESSSQPHPGEKFTEGSDYKTEPEKDRCHIYSVHQNGEIYWKSNAVFDGAEATVHESDGNNFCGDDRLTLMSVTYTTHKLQL